MKYRFLRGRLRQLGIDQTMVGTVLDLSQTSVSHRFTGRTPWTLDEMYKLMDLCREEPDMLHIYFPRDGIAKDDGYRLQIVKGGTA